MRDIPRYEPERLHSKADRAEDRALQGWNPSADSVAGIAGSENSLPLSSKQSWHEALNPRGSGTASPASKVTESLTS
jgi:hypothetical protein